MNRPVVSANSSASISQLADVFDALELAARFDQHALALWDVDAVSVEAGLGIVARVAADSLGPYGPTFGSEVGKPTSDIEFTGADGVPNGQAPQHAGFAGPGIEMGQRAERGRRPDQPVLVLVVEEREGDWRSAHQ
jgi:hypothetical protein